MDYQQRLGLTPIYVRLATTFLEKGVGTHPCNSLGYDKAKVSVLSRWDNHALPGDPPAYFMEYQVSFYNKERRTKWVDFKLSMTGGGGEPSFQVHDAEEDDEQ